VRARFVGKVDGLPAGWWVGVHYDEPVGKNDGSVKGVRYFACPPGHGGLLRPARVRVGDFPELDAFAFDSDDEI
jgi:tubulin-folding cofactor B